MKNDPRRDITTPVMNISNDCLLLTFHRLKPGIDRNSFGLTCHRWLRIQNSSRRSLWLNIPSHSFTSSRINPNIVSLVIFKLLTRFQQLSFLSLKGCCSNLPDFVIWQFFWSNVQALYLNGCFQDSDSRLPLMASRFPWLTSIRLCESIITNIGIGFNGCSETLVYLKADSCKLELEGISGIASRGGLEYLNLSRVGCGPWDDLGDGLAKIGEGFAMKLRVLNLQRLHGWEAIGLNCHNLVILNVSQCRNFCDRGLQALCDGCNKLSKLHMACCARISNSAIELFECRRSNVKISNHETVCVDTTIIMAGVCRPTSSWSYMRTYGMRQIIPDQIIISSTSIVDLLCNRECGKKWMPPVCRYPLNLASANRITSGIDSEYHKSIKKGFVSLLSVDIKGSCKLMSPDTYSFRIYKLLTRFQQLNLLSLSHSFELRDSDIGFSLMASGCPHLTFISLYRCNITDIGLEALAKSCLSLKKVNLSYCAITDIGLESLSKSCSSLQKLNLSYCALLSDRGIRFLSQYCRQLCSVSISNCKNITGIGFNGCSETLAYVEVVSCNLEPEGILGIVSGGGLEYLDLSSVDVLGLGLPKIGEGFAMKLRVLNLRICRDVSNEVVMKISKGCPLLQEWNLAHNNQINLHGWEAIGSNCHNLEILHVNLCLNLCDRGLGALRDGCKRLSVLYMDNRYARISHLAIELFKCRRADVKIMEKEILGVTYKNIF
ncbi:Leucine-rich repeat [Macleaya cordata]|uniref:Leucine-rich repeat n=1 Tax=Macleaya cordata TaxID=56857 RepID=A0A200Q3W1_MACCD|nr:Leucine-rich repeat [Macleaya cordata]